MTTLVRKNDIVVFLDFDGVLNYHGLYGKERTHKEWVESGIRYNMWGHDFDHINQKIINIYDPKGDFCLGIDPDCTKQLNRILDTTGGKVVISSTWRHINKPNLGRPGYIPVTTILHKALTEQGLDYPGDKFIGSTPHKMSLQCREAEISLWIINHCYETPITPVILDDAPMHRMLNPWSVQTDWFDGALNENKADIAINIAKLGLTITGKELEAYDY